MSLVLGEAGGSALLLGNEAIVRGALEAGVGFVSGYPGTPASEIGDTFHRLHRRLGIHFEYAVNEKVALELAFGASLTGVRSLVSMKHLGLSYGADPLSTMPYIGVVGGMVIVSAADPSCRTSPNEQDQRHLGRMLGLPTLDPATPDEARRMTAFAFELSEACELPVLLRITTRVCHTRAPVELAALPPPKVRGEFRRDPSRFVPMPVNARRMREKLQDRLDVACARLTASPFNPRTGPAPGAAAGPRRGIIATGAPRNPVAQLLAGLPAPVPLLELGALHPLPHDVILPFLRELDELLVVEELTPYVEDSLLAIAHHHQVSVKIRGKRDGRMPWPFELGPAVIRERLLAFLAGDARPPQAEAGIALPQAPPRPPVLCPGCPHRSTFHAVTATFGTDVVYVNDIGCYTLGALAPHEAGDVLLAMGSSIPMAAAIARSTGKRTVAFLGDSTFFHSGMPALLDAIEHADDVVVVILDNDITAMTGCQPNPGTPVDGSGAARPKRSIAAVAVALGASDVAVVDPFDLPATLDALQRARGAKGLSVVVAVRPCVIWAQKALPAAVPALPQVDPARCHSCGMADAGLHCSLAPSLEVQRRVAVQRALHATAPDREEPPATSPCSAECPLGICIPAYVGAIAAGEPERALQAVTLRAALPSVCSFICHRPCEQACVRGERDRTVAINSLKQYLTEHHLGPTPEAKEPPVGAAVAVVGAGPAGLSAARELVRRGYAATLLDAAATPGGMLEHAIPAYRLPREVLRRDVAAVLAEGVRFEGGKRLGRDFSLEELRGRGFAAIVLCLGASRGGRPPIPGAGLPGAVDALSFLAAVPALQGAQVVVVGGGDVAMDAARTAVRAGAATVTVLFPESALDASAAPETLSLARAEGIVLLPGRAAVELRAGPSGAVSCVVHRAVVGFTRAPGHKVRWDGLAGEERQLPASLAIFATGQKPELAGLDLPAGLVGPEGWLLADDAGRTAVSDLFVAGDVGGGPATVTAAMASGVRAAWAVDGQLSPGRAVPGPAAPPPRARPVARHHAAPQQRLPDEAAALTEAQRCLLCGLCQNCNACTELLGCPAIAREPGGDSRPVIVPELCIACGACVDVCPNRAIGPPVAGEVRP